MRGDIFHAVLCTGAVLYTTFTSCLARDHPGDQQTKESVLWHYVENVEKTGLKVEWFREAGSENLSKTVRSLT